LAQKKNRKDNRFPDSQCDREGHPYFWEGTDAARKSEPLQEGQAITLNTQHQEEYSNLEDYQFRAFDEIEIHRETDPEFESVCQQTLIRMRDLIRFLTAE